MPSTTPSPTRLASLQPSFEDLGTPLQDVTFVVVDLETTGGSPGECGITEIGAVKVRGGEVRDVGRHDRVRVRDRRPGQHLRQPCSGRHSGRPRRSCGPTAPAAGRTSGASRARSPATAGTRASSASSRASSSSSAVGTDEARVRLGR